MSRFRDEGVLAAQPSPPWHMWGTSERIATAGNIANVERQSKQLARVAYKRPENWRFWIQARLIGGDAPTVGPEEVRIRVNLAFGVGRSVSRTEQPIVAGIIQEAFVLFTWTVPIGVLPQNVEFSNKYVTSVQTPPVDHDDDTTRQLVDHIPAENIQAFADLTVLKAEAIAIETEVTVFFAPNVHVRPDWLRVTEREGALFRGGEIGGS